VGAVSVVNVIAFVWVMKKMNFGMSAISSSEAEDALVRDDAVVSRESMASIK
ncbi:Proton-dependent oligopeptide transporter, partial [Globisporangium polare]